MNSGTVKIAASSRVLNTALICQTFFMAGWIFIGPVVVGGGCSVLSVIT